MTKVFIDGSAGTTGLRIRERLTARQDLELLTIPEEVRKETAARKEYLNRADVVFLCLPDDAAREAVTLVENPATAIIDTSTAHRTAAGWTYGFAELAGQREKIAASKRIANPGCHASGFIALVEPLVRNGLLPADAMLTCFSLTGFSGGGKKMIADYGENPEERQAPRVYGLNQAHKHLPEMSKVCGLTTLPVFTPIVSSYYAGMEVAVSLFREQVKGTPEDIKALYKSYYTGKLVHFDDSADEAGFLSAGAYAGRDDLQVSVFGNGDRILLVSRFDNLGKGASGAAIQNMNILLGAEETTGLNVGEE